MPIYGYTCEHCGHTFDRLQKLSDPDPTTCPQCGKETLHRQISAPSFRLAGGGWYETDFKSGQDKKHNLADSGKSTEPSTTPKEGGAASTSESKATSSSATDSTPSSSSS